MRIDGNVKALIRRRLTSAGGLTMPPARAHWLVRQTGEEIGRYSLTTDRVRPHRRREGAIHRGSHNGKAANSQIGPNNSGCLHGGIGPVLQYRAINPGFRHAGNRRGIQPGRWDRFLTLCSDDVGVLYTFGFKNVGFLVTFLLGSFFLWVT